MTKVEVQIFAAPDAEQNVFWAAGELRPTWSSRRRTEPRRGAPSRAEPVQRGSIASISFIYCIPLDSQRLPEGYPPFRTSF